MACIAIKKVWWNYINRIAVADLVRKQNGGLCSVLLCFLPDITILFNAIAGQDAADATSPATNYGETLLQPKLETVRALTIGIPEEYFVSNLDSEIGLALQ